MPWLIFNAHPSGKYLRGAPRAWHLLQPSGNSFRGSQSDRANSTAKGQSQSLTRAVATATGLSKRSERSVGWPPPPDVHSALMSLSTLHPTRSCLSWPKKEMGEGGTARSYQAISHLTCAFHSRIVLLPLTPSHSLLL